MGEHRPSFIDTRLRESNKHFCENDYGMPSSHTFLVVLLCCFTFQQLDKNIHFIGEKLNYWLNVAILSIIAFTRLYLGVHTFMQVFFGGFLALTVFLICEINKDVLIANWIRPILRKTTRRKNILYKVSICMLIYTIIGFVICWRLRNWELNDESFFKKIKHCRLIFNSNFNFSGKDFGQVLMIYYFYGLFLGIYTFEGNFESFSNFNFDGNLKNFFLRSILSVVY